MFERIEFVPQLVFSNPDPQEEIERLNKEIEAVKEKETKVKDAEEIIEKIDLENVEEETIAEDKKPDDSFEDIDDLKDLDTL